MLEPTTTQRSLQLCVCAYSPLSFHPSKAFACWAKENRSGTGIALCLPNQRRWALSGETEYSERGSCHSERLI